MTRPVVLYVVGTRPELIRSVGVISHLRATTGLDVRVIHTGQHYDWNMSAGFSDLLGLGNADYSLNCPAGSSAEQIAAMMTGVADLAADLRPRCVCVFGDTNSSLAAALGAETAKVPVVHLEAGARSYDMSMPEEVNRRLIDHLSTLLFAVSDQCASNLRGERVAGTVLNFGDPLYEVFRRYYDPEAHRSERWTWFGSGRPYSLLTLHRQALVDDTSRLLVHLEMIGSFAQAHGMVVVFPVHPRTAKQIRVDAMKYARSFRFIGPVLYDELLALISGAALVVTDSGGLQKEAFWAKKPCVTVRANTEWIETIQIGVNCLAMDDDLPSALEGMLSVGLDRFDKVMNPYGDEMASVRIADRIAGECA